MRIAVIHREDVKWSIADVTDGLRHGLAANGVTVTDDWRNCDWSIVVNPMFQTPETLAAMRRRAPVAALCTETPYDIDQELPLVALVDAGWTHERVSVPVFQQVNPQFGYLPHAWHQERHGVSPADASLHAHDVVFVGTGFSERVTWINRIDWTGIDLGLYGIWDGMGLEEDIEQRCMKGQLIDNVTTAALYRRATIGLNLYRTRPGISQGWPRKDVIAESMNPRAYELAACGVFTMSSGRAEETETFGWQPIVALDDPKAAEATIRHWLAPERAPERAIHAAHLRQCVASESWTHRARQVIADLRKWSTA